MEIKIDLNNNIILNIGLLFKMNNTDVDVDAAKKAIIRERNRIRMNNVYKNDADHRAYRIAYMTELQKDPVYRAHANELRRASRKRAANKANIPVSV